MVLPKPKPKKKRLNPLTNKIARGGKGLEQRKGQKGIIPQYVTYENALKRLQLSRLDFRRLCILKGIFPRDPKKKAFGSDKTYYHIKDLQFLQHEPLLQKYRDLKVYSKKLKKAIAKSNQSKIELLKQNKPHITLDHLLRERYPTFIDALNDCDDALSTIFLFYQLPAKLIKQYTAARVEMNHRLCTEWLYYIISTQSLYKVFVSIKGIYYQIKHISNTGTMTYVTWLQPHRFTQYLPTDIDYKIILIFLQHYETLLKFVMYKLYSDNNMKYPPVIDTTAENQGLGLSQYVHTDSLHSQPTVNNAVIDTTTEKTANNKLQQSVSAIVQSIDETSNTPDNVDTVSINTIDDSMNDFKALGGEISTDEIDANAIKTVFQGKVFYLQRETPQQSLELVILCGGGTVYLENSTVQLTTEQQSSVTHVVIDRPTISNQIPTREYIQPQWIYDSFNTRVCLPVHPYTVGQTLPPHLSPFVDNMSEGYIPTQAKVLEQWRALARGEVIDTDENDNVEETVESEDDEVVYQRELANEKSGVTYTQLNEQQNTDTTEHDSDIAESDVDIDEFDEDTTEQEPIQPSKKAKVASDDLNEYAKIMMSQKDKHLYNAMMMTKDKKTALLQSLEQKRTKLEEDRSKTNKMGNKKRTQYKKGDKAKLAKAK